jgi:hypothetical protein
MAALVDYARHGQLPHFCVGLAGGASRAIWAELWRSGLALLDVRPSYGTLYTRGNSAGLCVLYRDLDSARRAASPAMVGRLPRFIHHLLLVRNSVGRAPLKAEAPWGSEAPIKRRLPAKSGAGSWWRQTRERSPGRTLAAEPPQRQREHGRSGKGATRRPAWLHAGADMRPRRGSKAATWVGSSSFPFCSSFSGLPLPAIRQRATRWKIRSGSQAGHRPSFCMHSPLSVRLRRPPQAGRHPSLRPQERPPRQPIL